MISNTDSKNLEIKKQKVEEVYSKILEVNPDIKNSGLNTVVLEYSKLTSNEFNDLRSKLFAKGASLKVVKNTLIKIIFNKFGVKTDSTLEGQNAMLIANEDFIGSVKTISDFLKKSAKGVFKIGVLEGDIIGEKEVQALAKLPTKDVLIGQFVSGLASPIRGFVYTLNGVQTNFVRALNAIAEKKGA